MHMRSLGSIIGGLAAGPLGSLVGGLAGGLVGAASESLVPGASGVLANAFGASGAEALQSLGARLHANLPEDQRRRVNHDLQAAFRAAALEALYDLGGPVSFPERWTPPRDAPPPIPFAFNTYSQDTTALLANCLVQLEHAIQQQQVLPVAPPHDLAAASVYTYVEQTTLEALSADDTAARQTLAQLGDAFFAQAIAPWLDQEFPSLMVAAADPQDPRQRDELAAGQALREHLRTHLLERTLVHFNEQIKSPQHTEAWRAFNRLLLEELRASLATVGASQQQLADDQRALVQRLEVLIGQTDTEALSQFAGGMADLIATVGRTHQQTGEQLDGLLLRVSAQGDNLLALLTQNSAILAIVQDSALDISEVRRQVELLRDAFAVVKPGLERVAWVIPSQFQAEQSCPYPGLAVFDEQQAARFYGREDDVRAFLARPVRPVTVISGPSGVGKSSFVQAGLLPQLKQRSATPLQTLVYRVSTSGELLSALAAFCAQQGAGDAAQLLAQFNQRDDALREVLRQIRPSPDGAVVLVLDQFEELFVGDDPARASDRRQLLDNLLQLERQPESWLSVILTSRENFFEHPDYLARERLRELVQAENVRLGGLSDQQLRAAITRPLENFAAQHGLHLRFEAGVVDLLLNDFRKTERTLPLVQYLLRLLWTEQHELSNAAYNRLGGIERALDRHASAIYERFNEREQRKVNAVLLALVRPGIANEYTRRRVRRDTLIGPDPAQRDHAAIVQQLAHPNSRLISEQQIGDVAYLELTHEVLLRQWERLRLLIELYKTRLQQREALLPNAEQWVQSLAQRGGRGDSAYLYRGNQLRQARAYIEAKELPEAVDHDIQRCYQASVQHQRRSLAFSGAAVVVAALLIWFGFTFFTSDLQAGRAAAEQAAQTAAAERGVAEGQRAEAEAEAARERRATTIRDLIAKARDADTEHAILLSVEALQLSLAANEPVVLEAEQLLRDALSTIGGRPLDPEAFAVALSPDGQTLVTQNPRGLSVWDLRAADPRTTAHEISGEVGSLALKAFGPDSRTLITTQGEVTILVWDVSDPDPVNTRRELRGHRAAIQAYAFSPNGQWLASSSDDLTIRIWDLREPDPNRNVRTWRGYSGQLVFSADSQFLISGDAEGSLRLWDLQRPDSEANWLTLRAAGEIDTLALHPNGATLISGGTEAVQIWDLRNPNPAATVQILPDAASPLALSRDGRVLITERAQQQEYAHSVLAWDVADLTVLPREPHELDHRAPVVQMQLNADGTTLMSIDQDDQVYIWDLTVRSWFASSRIVSTVQDALVKADLIPHVTILSPDGQQLFVGGRVWALDEPDQAAIWQTMRSASVWIPSQITFNVDGSKLLVADGNAAQLWDFTESQPHDRVHLLPQEGFALGTFSPDHRSLALPGSNNSIQIWDFTNNKPTLRHTLIGHTGSVTAMCFDHEGNTLFSGDEQGELRMWSLQAPVASPTGQVLSTSPIYIADLAVSADGQTLLGTSRDGLYIHQLHVTYPEPATKIIRTGGNTSVVALSPDGATFAVGYDNGKLQLWDMRHENPATTVRSVDVHTNKITGLVFGLDGNMLISGDFDGNLYFWNVATSNQISEIQKIDMIQEIIMMAISHNGKTFALIGSDDNGMRTRVFDLTNPLPLTTVRTMLSNTGEVPLLALSPDGANMAVTGHVYARGTPLPGVDYHAIYTWSLDPASLIEPACRAVGRNFTLTEWQSYFGNEPYRQICMDEASAAEQ